MSVVCLELRLLHTFCRRPVNLVTNVFRDSQSTSSGEVRPAAGRSDGWSAAIHRSAQLPRLGCAVRSSDGRTGPSDRPYIWNPATLPHTGMYRVVLSHTLQVNNSDIPGISRNILLSKVCLVIYQVSLSIGITRVV